MTRVRVKAVDGGISELAKSPDVGEALKPLAEAVLDGARTDPNEEYVASLQMHRFLTTGPGGRVSWQVGAAPTLGDRVEAKRGTLARALGRVN